MADMGHRNTIDIWQVPGYDSTQPAITCSKLITETLVMWNIFKVNNKDTRTTPMASLWRIYCYLQTYFTPCPSVSIINFYQVNADWVCTTKNAIYQNRLPMLHFYIPWKHRETFGLLVFLGDIEMEHWAKMKRVRNVYYHYSGYQFIYLRPIFLLQKTSQLIYYVQSLNFYLMVKLGKWVKWVNCKVWSFYIHKVTYRHVECNIVWMTQVPKRNENSSFYYTMYF